MIVIFVWKDIFGRRLLLKLRQDLYQFAGNADSGYRSEQVFVELERRGRYSDAQTKL